MYVIVFKINFCYASRYIYLFRLELLRQELAKDDNPGH